MCWVTWSSWSNWLRPTLAVVAHCLRIEPHDHRESAATRNRIVATSAKDVLIAYAEPGGQTAKLAADLTKTGRPSWTLASPGVARFANG